MAKKKAKGFTEGDDLNDAAAEFLRSQKDADKLTQAEVDRLFKLAVQNKDPAAIRDLRELIAEGKAHIPVGGAAPVLGPAPKAAPAVAPPVKDTGKATAQEGKQKGQPLPEAESDLKRRAGAVEAEKADKEAARIKRERGVATVGEAETLAEAPKGKARGKAPVERPKDTGPVVVPQVPQLAEKPGVAEMGAKAAQEFRERAAKMGVDADRILEESKTGVKQLDQLPDNLATKNYLEKWLQAQAESPAARANVALMKKQGARLAARTPAERKADEKREAAERGATRAEKRRAVGRFDPEAKKQVVTADELLKKNFAEQSSERFKGQGDKLVQNRILVSAVDRRKAAEMTAIDEALEALDTGRPGTPLADELKEARKQLGDARTPEQQRSAMNRLVSMHPRFVTRGKLKPGVVDIERTGEVVRARIKEEAIQARGAFVDTSNPRQFNAKKRALFSDLKRATGAKSVKELKAVIKEQGIDVDLSRAKSQKDLLELMREKDVEKLEAFVATNRKDQAKQAQEIKSGKRKGVAVSRRQVPPTGLAGEAAEVAGENEFGIQRAVKGAAAKGKTGTFTTELANRLRAVLKEKGLTEEGLLGQIYKASTKGMTYNRIEDLPEGLDKRISQWITKAEATRPTPPTGKKEAKGAPKTEPKGVPPVADPVAEAKRAPKAARSSGGKAAPAVEAAAVQETGQVGRGVAGAGPLEPRKVGRQFKKQPVAMPQKVVPGVMGPVGKAPGTFGVGGGGALARLGEGAGGGGMDAKGLRDMLGAGGGGAAQAVKETSRFSGLARVLGPIGIAFGVYEILSRLKGQTVDRADEERLRVMEALGGMRGAVQEEQEMQGALGQQGMMVGMAGMQRQRDLDAMKRVYTGNADMDRLVRSNEDLLASIAMPSQPSMAELMARI